MYFDRSTISRQLAFITSRDDGMEASQGPYNARLAVWTAYGVVCNCDDVLILVFHAAFENDSFPLKQHASVISTYSIQNAKDPHRPIYIVFPHKSRSCKEGTPLNAPSVCADTSIA